MRLLVPVSSHVIQQVLVPAATRNHADYQRCLMTGRVVRHCSVIYRAWLCVLLGGISRSKRFMNDVDDHDRQKITSSSCDIFYSDTAVSIVDGIS